MDTWWREAGEPSRWTVVDAGAGPATLLRTLIAAEPACAAVLEPLAVDRSPAQRARQPDTVDRRAALPEAPITGVVLANELLDNVPWRLVERGPDGWSEVLVDAGGHGDLVEVVGPIPVEAADRADRLAPDTAAGRRIPLQDRGAAWLAEAFHRVEQGRVVVLDYGALTAEMAVRPQEDWLRTYRDHQRGTDPLVAPGSRDVTVEVATDQLAAVRPPDEHRSQSEFLRAHGLDDLVAEGRAEWSARAHLGDLAAMQARSRIGEAAALTDEAGLGAFRVLEWRV